jgi:hypothetical protein
MTVNRIRKMNEDEAVDTVHMICDGLKDYVANNPEGSKALLEKLIAGTIEPLSENDFFGTEGWESAFGVEP